MPTTATLARSLSSVLDKAPDAPTLPELLRLVDDYVHDVPLTDLESQTAQAAQLEDDLVSLHHSAIDYSSIYQLEVLLAFQFHLGPILPPTTIISWFDPILRPALREPRLPTASLNHAKELIISTLRRTHGSYLTRVGDFRRRLMELYLLDAFNEVSGGDVLEWASLSQDERERRTRWKSNLQDILIAYGHEVPEAFFTEVDRQFQVPGQRLQLLMLLNEFTSSSKFCSTVPVFASHKLMKSLANSLFLDNSSTVCTAAVTLCVKFLPYFAVYARDTLKTLLPKLLAILARIMCWKERAPTNKNPLAQPDEEFERELYREALSRPLHIRPDLEWERLEMTFTTEPSPPPSSRHYFSVLYYLYPSNVLKFIRGPVAYLTAANLTSPYTESWDAAFDEMEIIRKSENFVREHICHPFIVWSTATNELSKPEFWAKYGLGRIVSEATMMDVRALSMGLRERYKLADKGTEAEAMPSPSSPLISTPAGDDYEDDEPARFIRPIDLSSGKTVISLQDMIEASVALKSSIDLEILKPKKSAFPTSSSQCSTSSSPPPPPDTESEGQEGSSHVAQAISGLQRDVLLLRNELNFELWHQRENSKHLGRLYEDRILMRTAESERQGLYNKLRRYRAQVVALESELRDHKKQAAGMKHGYADWTKELQEKLKDHREEKKRMATELSNAQASRNDLKELFEAQGKRLAESLQEIFILRAETKENLEKIERLKDYEQQIEELTKMRQIWEDDSRKFMERKEELERKQMENEALQAQVEQLQRAQDDDETAREYRRQIQSLELRLAQMEPISEDGSKQRLLDENALLKSEIEALRRL